MRHLRLGQLIQNATWRDGVNLFNVEDFDLIAMIEETGQVAAWERTSFGELDRQSACLGAALAQRG